jgi:hypothetical protein
MASPFTTAIVTGSDSGIGKATAVALAERGHDVGITFNRDEDGARATAKEVEALGRKAVVVHLDVSRPDDAGTTIGVLADELGGVDVLVNNAGTGRDKPALEVTLEDWRDVVDTDLTGAFFAAQEAAKRMIAAGRGGRIINVTSVHEHVPKRGATAYVAAKHGLGGVTKNLALELAEHGITVNAVAPGEIATPMTGAEDVDPHTEERKGIPAHRPGDAHEIAAAICWLAAPEAAYATGASFVVDGGMLLMAAEATTLVDG